MNLFFVFMAPSYLGGASQVGAASGWLGCRYKNRLVQNAKPPILYQKSPEMYQENPQFVPTFPPNVRTPPPPLVPTPPRLYRKPPY